MIERSAASDQQYVLIILQPNAAQLNIQLFEQNVQLFACDYYD